MFKLFKRKNEMKELKCRLEVLEAEVITLKTQKAEAIDFSRSWGDELNLKGCTFDGGLIKNSKFSADKASLGNCNKEAVVSLENIEFIDKLAKKVSSIIEKNKESQSSITILNTDGVGVFKSVSGNVRIENVSPKVNKIIHKISSKEGNETTLTFDKEGMTLSVNKPELKEESKTNGDLALQIDGEVIGKVALEQIKKMQRYSGIKMVNV